MINFNPFYIFFNIFLYRQFFEKIFRFSFKTVDFLEKVVYNMYQMIHFMEKIMKEDVTAFLSRVFLFFGLSSEEISLLLKSVELTKTVYKKHEDIFLPDNKEEKIGFILRGECLVERVKPDGEGIPLNTLSEYDSFGILSVLSVEEFPTRVKASKDTEILFVQKEDFLGLIERSPVISMNVIKFLSRKISFLNKKIATFSSDTVEQKLARYVYSLYKKCDTLELTFNCKRTAEALNAGRASVYRALDSLSSDGIISFESKKIYIKDLIGLERIAK